MKSRDPIAFLSYVRDDDIHDFGRISDLRMRLQGEVRIQTGRPFPIFQDRNDIEWGERWRERIKEAIGSISFLIPIVTPSYFRSNMCREEFESFLIREKAIGLPRLILPIYYVSSDEFDNASKHPDDIAKVLLERNWSDWRDLRFASLDDPKVREQIATLAKAIKHTMVDLNAEIDAENRSISQTKQPEPPPPQTPPPHADQNRTASENPLTIPVVRNYKQSKMKPRRAKLQPYYIYTTNFDEIISPRQMMSSEESLRLHENMLKIIKSEYSQFKAEIENESAHITEVAEKKEISITILVDNSGSMRGKKIEDIAAWSSITSSILSSAGIENEVLGFTTKAWKGGQSRETWLSDGKPDFPGRLNDLRHIIYKSFDETFQEADINFSAMTKTGLLKENIDGEAILWAYSRLQRRHAERKILVALSDGAPVDDSTLAQNDLTFLSNHLKFAISSIRSLDDVEVYGVGIGHNVDDYYGEFSPILNENQIGPDLLRVISLIIRNDTPGLKSFKYSPTRPILKLETTTSTKSRKIRRRTTT